MAVFTDRNPEWLKWIAPDAFNDEDLFRIVTFYVFHSPCPMMSSMGKLLNEYKWTRPWQKPYYLNRHLKKASSNFELLYSAQSYNAMEEALKQSEMSNDEFPSNFKKERICIYNCQNAQFLSVFYHLRNAIAHCRLNMVDVDGECVFVMEDVQPNKKNEQVKVSARMILKKSTLLKWIDIIEAGEKTIKKNKENAPITRLGHYC